MSLERKGEGAASEKEERPKTKVYQPHVSTALETKLEKLIECDLATTPVYSDSLFPSPVTLELVIAEMQIGPQQIQELSQVIQSSPYITLADAIVAADESQKGRFTWIENLKVLLGKEIKLDDETIQSLSVREMCSKLVNSPHDKAIMIMWDFLRNKSGGLKVGSEIETIEEILAPFGFIPNEVLTVNQQWTIRDYITKSNIALREGEGEMLTEDEEQVRKSLAESELGQLIRFLGSEHPFTKIYIANQRSYLSIIAKTVNPEVGAQTVCDKAFEYALNHFGSNLHMLPEVFSRTFILKILREKKDSYIGKNARFSLSIDTVRNLLIPTRSSPESKLIEEEEIGKIADLIELLDNDEHYLLMQIIFENPEIKIEEIAERFKLEYGTAYSHHDIYTIKHVVKVKMVRWRKAFEAGNIIIDDAAKLKAYRGQVSYLYKKFQAHQISLEKFVGRLLPKIAKIIDLQFKEGGKIPMNLDNLNTVLCNEYRNARENAVKGILPGIPIERKPREAQELWYEITQIDRSSAYVPVLCEFAPPIRNNAENSKGRNWQAYWSSLEKSGMPDPIKHLIALDNMYFELSSLIKERVIDGWIREDLKITPGEGGANHLWWVTQLAGNRSAENPNGVDGIALYFGLMERIKKRVSEEAAKIYGHNAQSAINIWRALRFIKAGELHEINKELDEKKVKRIEIADLRIPIFTRLAAIDPLSNMDMEEVLSELRDVMVQWPSLFTSVSLRTLNITRTEITLYHNRYKELLKNGLGIEDISTIPYREASILIKAIPKQKSNKEEEQKRKYRAKKREKDAGEETAARAQKFVGHAFREKIVSYNQDGVAETTYIIHYIVAVHQEIFLSSVDDKKRPGVEIITFEVVNGIAKQKLKGFNVLPGTLLQQVAHLSFKDLGLQPVFQDGGQINLQESGISMESPMV